MKSSYKRLGNYIEPCGEKNTGNVIKKLQGISNKKYFQKAKTNTIGIDLSKYRVVRTGQFAFNRATTRNGDKISIALRKGKDCIVSPSYRIFKSKDETILNSEYLMMWFKRPEFDRYARFKSHGSAHEFFDYDEMCDVELPIPSIDIQQAIVDEYNTVVNRISLNEQLNAKLEETAQALYNHWFEENTKEDWMFKKLSDLIDIQGGYSYKSKKMGKGNSYLLGMGCVSFTERFLEKGMRLYSDDVPEKHLIGSNEIVIATRQQTENYPILGAPSMIPNSLDDCKIVVASNLYKVKNKSSFTNRFIFQLLRSNGYKEHIKLNAKGTTVGMITKGDIENFELKLPKDKVIFEFEKNLNPVVDRIEQCTLETKRFIELQSFLLSKMSKTVKKELVTS